MNNAKCASHHFGPWAIDEQWLRSYVDGIKSGVIQSGEHPKPEKLYENNGGVAVIDIAGPMMKIRSKYGGTSTVDTREALRNAMADPDVKAIMLHIDSPGGTVAGTDQLASDVEAARKTKPVRAHIEDMGASAAYYVASQAREISATRGSLVGSLGVKLIVVDSSKQAEKEGIQVHAVATGDYKAAGEDGLPITEKQLAYFQQIVDNAATHFKAALKAGRGWSDSQLAALFDGRVYDTDIAVTNGLIDKVSSFDDAMKAAMKEVNSMNLESFNAFAAEHPEAVATHIEAGRKAGESDARRAELDRHKAIVAACNGDYKLAAESFAAGHDAEHVKLAADTAAREKGIADAIRAEYEAKLAAVEKKLEQATFAAGTQGAVGMKKAPAVAKPNATPEEAAKAEWAADATLADDWLDEKTFVAYRADEIRRSR